MLRDKAMRWARSRTTWKEGERPIAGVHIEEHKHFTSEPIPHPR
jgi:hypothetical protein